MQTELGIRGPGNLPDDDRVETELIKKCEELHLSPSLTSSQL